MERCLRENAELVFGSKTLLLQTRFHGRIPL
jgi:hypothetical protein